MYQELRERTTRTDGRERVRNEIAILLGQRLSPDAMLESVVGTLIPDLADLAAIDLVHDDGSLLRKLTKHVDPEMERVLDAQRSENPLPLTASYGYPRVIKTGKSQFIPGVTELVADRLFPEAKLVLDGVVIRSYICVPLTASGHILGALTVLTTGTGKAFDGNDLHFFEELGETIADRLDAPLRDHQR